MLKIIHFRNKCIGCNSCVEHAPNRWEISIEDGKSNLKRSEKKGNVYIADIGEEERVENEEAAKDCPVNVIRIENY